MNILRQKNACKKIVNNYKKISAQKLKEEKAVLKEELSDYKLFAKDFNELKKADTGDAKSNEIDSPLMFRSKHNKGSIEKNRICLWSFK